MSETLDPGGEPAATASQTFASLAAQRIALPADDVVHVMLPLMRAVAALHARERVAALGPADVVEAEDGALMLARPLGEEPQIALEQILRVQPHANSALKVVGEYRVTTEDEVGSRVDDLQASVEDEAAITKPVYLSGYRAWEKELGHHDETTDVFCVGLILASLACGLDFNVGEDVEQFSLRRTNLFSLNPRLHPVIATLILETTALDRRERATDLAEIAKRLQTYRDQPVGLDVERVLAEAKGAPSRRTAVLSHLRDRLFDLSRRNRLIHFRPTQASVNMTEASVPLVLRIESIRPEQLCVWSDHVAKEVLSGAPAALGKWLRFEEHPYLPSALDRIIQETRRDRAEYGFSHLRLVVGFLRWHNLKDAPNDRIVSPLLWLPVEVTKKKGVRDQYMVRCLDEEAEFNPALRHYLRQLYDIRLPERIDLTETSLEQVHADLAAQIHRSEPGVQLSLQTRAAINLIQQKAVQRVRQFERRRGVRAATSSLSRPDFSYDANDYRPLGLALFEKYVRPSPLPQRLAAGGSLAPRPDHMLPVGSETESKTFALAADEGHRFAWELDLTQVTLANFNYKKMSLVRDYNQLIETPSEQPAFDRIFSIEPRALEDQPPEPLALAEQWGVVASDAAQEAAVALARSGRSFIIQGPPGTGKSQTITNLIADYAARGKRVLFVCEKRAALDVVFHRLHQAGLSKLACLIHDSQEDKKAFVMDLRDCYEDWAQGEDGLEQVSGLRSRTLSVLSAQLTAIGKFDSAVSTPLEGANASLRTLVRRAMSLPAPDPSAGPRLREQLPSPAEWDGRRSLVERTARSMSDAFGLASLAQHPFSLLSAATVADVRSFARVEAFIESAERLLSGLEDTIEAGQTLITGDLSFNAALRLARAARQARKTGLSRNLGLLDPRSSLAADFERACLTLTDREETRAKAAEAARHWTDPLAPEDTAAALDQARRQERSFLRFLSGSWRRLSRTVVQRYDFSAHAVKPSIVAVLERLTTLHAADAAHDAELKLMERQFYTPDVQGLIECRGEFVAGSKADPLLAALVDRARSAIEPATAMAGEADAAEMLEPLASLIEQHLDGAAELTLSQLGEAIRDMREGLEDLPDLLSLLAAVDQAGPQMAYALRRLPMAPVAIEALVVDEAIARAERADPELRRFDIDRLLSLSRRASAARDRIREENAAVIRATMHNRFRRNVKQSSLSITQLDSEGKRFKKRYSTGRREAEHEFGKTMRYRSIRELAGGDSGLVLNDLKPIWLMSPLSVSDTLPLEGGLFDVAIFDEASQIPIEEAAPALSRAGQVIVVGDEMQLPPTSFFSTALDEEDAQVTAEEDGETMSILLDADSLLSQSARNLPATLLAWHYRSRSESLISFSNAAFYDGRLVTIPDRGLASGTAAAAPAISDAEIAFAEGAERLLQAPISVHRVADGLYEARANIPEARYIAGLVRALLAKETALSLGVVAFSEAQQTEIETALDALAVRDPAFADRLEREYVREDDGQFNGLFVKNLENVQGDERDLIILSICYAPGRDGRMVMNFGPINQRGGEKRLNVIFSRARHHMAVVSTIGAEAITNTHNDGARALRTFLAYAEAQDVGATDRARSILATLNPDAGRTFGAAPPADAARQTLAEALRARGHQVHEHVGTASFRCDLGIVGKDGAGYALGVLLDRDGEAMGGVGDRFVFRPGILRAFGWRVLDLPVTRWLRDPAGVVARIEAELIRDSWQDLNEDVFDGDELAPPAAAPPPPALTIVPTTEPAPQPQRGAPAVMKEFRFQQGGSNKFWRIGAEGCDVTVVFGRIGTKGQSVIKTFATAERAQAEVAKLTAEKTRKGYQPAD
jgi:predicted DNA-binding WGR domain protein